jgi:triacylglycerol lipase
MRKFSLARAGVIGIVALFALGAGCGGSNATNDTPTDAGGDVSFAPDTTPPLEAAPEVGNGSGAPYPIVLAHGMGGFGTLKGLPITYFNGIKDDLAKTGESQIFVTLVPPYDTSENRAKELAKQIDQILTMTGKTKVNLIGHSQGGMDARILASPNGLGYGDRLASVTTVATPHHGSRVADVVLNILPADPTLAGQLVNAIVQLMERSVYEVQTDPTLKAQIGQLSEHYMETVFNPKYTDDPRVPYFSYAGRTDALDGLPDCTTGLYPDDPTKLNDAQVFIKPMADYLQNGMKKPNDGLVTVQSARGPNTSWTFLQCVPADHMREVGQLNLTGPDPKSGFDHLQFWRTVVARLRGQGY